MRATCARPELNQDTATRALTLLCCPHAPSNTIRYSKMGRLPLIEKLRAAGIDHTIVAPGLDGEHAPHGAACSAPSWQARPVRATRCYMPASLLAGSTCTHA